MKRVLITGGTGFVGRELFREFSPDFHVLAAGRKRRGSIRAESFRRCDIKDKQAVQRMVRAFRPHIVLHAAAIAGIDRCEREPLDAFETNFVGTLNIAEACRPMRPAFVLFSTDNVFDSTGKQGVEESHAPSPLNVYGLTKHWCEEAVRSLLPRHIIARSAWIFGNESSFVRELTSGRKVMAASDWLASPVYVRDLAAAVRMLVTRGHSGTFHLSNGGSATRWDFAETLRRAMRDKVFIRISRCRLASLHLAAKRPRSGVLISRRWERLGLPAFRDWRQALREMAVLLETAG